MARPKRAALPALAFAALVLAATCGWGVHEAGGAGSETAADAVIPPYELTSLAGGTVGPEEFSGRVVVYDFWATWCTPCHVQVEILQGLYSRAGAAGVEFVAVATGEPEEIVRRYLAKSPYPYPVLLDPDERLATELEVLGLPTLIVANRQGRIVWRQTGLTDSETLIAALVRAGVEWPD